MIAIDINTKKAPTKEPEAGQVWKWKDNEDCFIILKDFIMEFDTQTWLVTEYTGYFDHPPPKLLTTTHIKHHYIYLCEEDDIEVDVKITINI